MGLDPSLLFVMACFGGLASAGISMLIALERGLPSTSAVSFAVAWYALVFIPLAWGIFGEGNQWSPASRAAYDYAGAIPFHIGLGSAAAMLGFATRKARRPLPTPTLRIARGAYLVGLLAVSVFWASWLAFSELDMNAYTVALVRNTVIFATASLAASLAVQWAKTGSVSLRGCGLGVVCGLATATGTGASVSAPAATVIGLLAGALAAHYAHNRSRSGERSFGALMAIANLVGGITGLVAVGLLDQARGFLYTGAPELPMAQVTAVTASALYALAISGLLAYFATRVTERRRQSRTTTDSSS